MFLIACHLGFNAMWECCFIKGCMFSGVARQLNSNIAVIDHGVGWLFHGKPAVWLKGKLVCYFFMKKIDYLDKFMMKYSHFILMNSDWSCHGVN